MSATPKTQTRGNCQCCGRDQAVLASGRMSKHGYTVENGWFDGVCSGQHYVPLQRSRERADQIVAEVRAGCDALDERVAGLRSGEILPTQAATGRRIQQGRFGYVREMGPFAEQTPEHQQQAIRSAIYECESRSRAGRAFAAQLARLADELHGTELRVVEIEEGPARIIPGERRQTPRGIIVARDVERGNVLWTRDDDDRPGCYRMGVQSWRRLPLAA